MKIIIQIKLLVLMKKIYCIYNKAYYISLDILFVEQKYFDKKQSFF